MFGVLGSGFGIYGYVPSILNMDGGVCLLEKARELCEERKETRNLLDKISWASDREDLIRRSSGLVIAQPPSEQFNIIEQINKHSLQHGIRKVILEKPLATTPELADALLNKLDLQTVRLRVGYIFYCLPWFKELQKLVSNSNSNNLNIEIKWLFQAHNLVNQQETWKKYHSQGGGCLRFYGIHLIAILAYLDFMTVNKSSLLYMSDDIPVKWEAEFTNATGHTIKIIMDILAPEKKFALRVRNDLTEFIALDSVDIFMPQQSQYHDVRSYYIDMLLHSFNEDDASYYRWYFKTNELWALIEKQTQTKDINI